MTTKGNNQSQVNARELALDILYEILEKDGYSHLVLNQALSKYQYLGKQDRSLITRITEGTLEYLIQIDAVIDQFSKTKGIALYTEKMPSFFVGCFSWLNDQGFTF